MIYKNIAIIKPNLSKHFFCVNTKACDEHRKSLFCTLLKKRSFNQFRQVQFEQLQMLSFLI